MDELRDTDPMIPRYPGADRRTQPEEWGGGNDHFAAQLGASRSGRLRFTNGAHRVVIRAGSHLRGLYRASFGERMPIVVVRGGEVPLFVGSYLAVWTLVGVAVYAVYRPHGSFAAGVVVIAAGLYEFTPLKRHFRRRCRDSVRSGFEFGLYCVGSSIGLMLMLVALGVMSITWMSVITVLVLAQKLLPPKAAIDVPLALAIVGLGDLIILAPSSVPGLTPPM
jgi:hypothetical protein